MIHLLFSLHSQLVNAVLALQQVLSSRQVFGSLAVVLNGVLGCHEWEECLHFLSVTKQPKPHFTVFPAFGLVV